MGTRSLTVFKEIDEKGSKEICVMYRQFDGYPTGHGIELAEFLAGMKMVNGIRVDDVGKIANGMGCLTAQVISHFKDGVGSIYIYPADTRNCWEEYVYIITGKENFEPEIECISVHSEEYGGNKVLFKGTASEFVEWIKINHNGEDEE